MNQISEMRLGSWNQSSSLNLKKTWEGTHFYILSGIQSMESEEYGNKRRWRGIGKQFASRYAVQSNKEAVQDRACIRALHQKSVSPVSRQTISRKLAGGGILRGSGRI